MRLGLSGPSSASLCCEVDFRMCLGAGLWTPRAHSQVTVPTGFVSHRRRYCIWKEMTLEVPIERLSQASSSPCSS